MTFKSFKQFMEQARTSNTYAIAKAQLKFSRQIKILMRNNSITAKQMALTMKCTPANISKLINGETNLRIESMIKLARAAGGEFNFDIIKRDVSAEWFNSPSIISSSGKIRSMKIDSSATFHKLNDFKLNDSVYSCQPSGGDKNAA